MGFIYQSLKSVSTMTKLIITYFRKMNSVFNLKIIIIFIIFSYCDMNSEIIQNVVYDNYNDFQHVNFISSQNFISLFWGLFNDETDLRVRCKFFLNIGILIVVDRHCPSATCVCFNQFQALSTQQWCHYFLHLLQLMV